MSIVGFHHVAIIASDYLKSKDFYTTVLGAEVIHETYRSERDSYKLDLCCRDGSQIELFSFPDSPTRLTYPEACGLRHLAFRVEQLDRFIDFLGDKGIECEPVRVDPITGKRFTFLRDPDDLPLELYEM